MRVSAQKLNLLMMLKGLGVVELASRAGTSRQRTSILHNRGGNVGHKTVYRLATALECSPLDLLDEGERALLEGKGG